MTICGEHGDDIAYSGRDCPACAEIEELNSDHDDAMKTAENGFESEIADMQDIIDELEEKLDGNK